MLFKGSVKIALTLGIASAVTLAAANTSNYTYLALGDSVAFGLNPTLLKDPPPPASTFVGYPEVIAYVENLYQSNKEVNAACPGETSGSFIASGVPDYGCNSMGPQEQPAYKTWAGLHTNYPGTQLSFAVSQLKANPHINLITLGIGSNDVLLALRLCNNDLACVGSQMPTILQTYAANLAYILQSIRGTGYKGTIVLVGYYSPSADLIPIAQALNSTMLTVGANFRTIYADGFTAFQTVAIPYGGDVCKAGLLIHLDATTCDIHPSPLGRNVLAVTVMAATGFKF
jgi:lysophospholipase L1-like esterase